MAEKVRRLSKKARKRAIQRKREIVDPDNTLQSTSHSVRRTRKKPELYRSSKLTKAIGGVVRRVMEDRGLEESNMAALWGCTRETAQYAVQGRRLPNRELAARIKAWIFENVTFEKTPLLPAVSDFRRSAYATVNVSLPKDVYRRLVKTARRSEHGISLWTELALIRLLSHEATVTTYLEAIQHVSEARMHEALREAPELADILRTDFELAKRLGELAPKEAAIADPIDPITSILNTHFVDGHVAQPLGDADEPNPWDLDI